MKLTEAKLKQLIKEVLEEGMNTADMLPEDVFITAFEDGDTITVGYSDSSGEMIMPWDMDTDEDNDVWGDVSFYKRNPNKFRCLDSSIISVTEVADGWGPLLYDVAMEIATIISTGLAADRATVSPEAQRVWDYYDKNRADVSKQQLDNPAGELTPDYEDDDCIQASARKSQKAGEWMKSPLSRTYSKEPTTLKQLKAAGKLINQLPNLKF